MEGSSSARKGNESVAFFPNIEFSLDRRCEKGRHKWAFQTAWNLYGKGSQGAASTVLGSKVVLNPTPLSKWRLLKENLSFCRIYLIGNIVS